MNFPQSLIIHFIQPVVGIMITLIIVWVIMSWLISFGVLNLRNPNAAKLVDVLNRLVDPIVAPIRAVVPSFGGLDVSPIIAIFGLSWIKNFALMKLFYMLG